MKKLLFFFFIFFHFYGYSQKENAIIIKGQVLDIHNQAIFNANISVIGSSKGTKTNSKGVFYLTVQQKVTTLKISHIAYYPKNKILVGNVINDTLRITIQLTQKINRLEAFEISAEKIELLYKKNFVYIYDFQFYEDKLLLLVNSLKVIKLRLTDNNQKPLKELIMPPNTKEIYLDCFGNIHALSKDSAYQIEINAEKMSIIYRVPINKFNTILKPCVTQFKNTFIFKEKEVNGDISYYYVDEDKNYHYLTRMKNTIRIVGRARRNAAIIQLENSSASKMSESKSSIYAARELGTEIEFSNLLLKNLDDTPLILVKDTVRIFDHPNNSCYVFDENLELKTTIPIDYHHQKKWDKELIIDEEQGEVYAKFKKDGLCYLKKIDLQTGKIIASYKLEKHTYPTKIKIRNREAYYLYKDYFNHGQMSLFKQGLY